MVLTLYQDIRTVLEDEDVLTSRDVVLVQPVETLLKWFQLSIQWTEGVTDLVTGLNGPITITALELSTTRDSRSQASLDDLLRFILPPRGDIPVVKKAIQRVAHERMNDALLALDQSNWGMLTAERWDQWSTSFTGKHHCETILASLRRCDPEAAQEHIVAAKRGQFRNIVKDIKVRLHTLESSFKCTYV